MLVKGYFNNYPYGSEEDGFIAEINAREEDIEKYIEIARCLYQEYDEDLEDYEFSVSLDEFIDSANDCCVSYKDYLGFVLDDFKVDWNWYNVPCDLEICIN